MPKKNMTAEERKAFGEKMKAARAAKQVDVEPTISPDQDVNDLKRQVEEMKQHVDLMRQLMVANQQAQSGVSMSRTGEVIGEFEKYIMDPNNYPDPTPRLSKEPRLAPIAFEHNYELVYEIGRSKYTTITGRHTVEPKFMITLLKKVVDDQGNRVQVKDEKTGKMRDKFYIARKLIFHEDPDAAMTIARENDIEINESDERLFLNEMRYLRVRDWLFDIFWPRPSQDAQSIQEEAIGGQIVQIFTRNSEETGSIPFDKMTSKLRT